jgi:small-conductance mechanosensitive channel
MRLGNTSSITVSTKPQLRTVSLNREGRKVMLWRIVAVFIFVLVTTGALSIIRAQWKERRTGVLVNRTLVQIAYILFWVSASALLLLLTGYFTATQILAALVFSLLIPCFAVLLSTVLSADRKRDR